MSHEFPTVIDCDDCPECQCCKTHGYCAQFHDAMVASASKGGPKA